MRDWHLDRHRKLFQAFLDVADTGATPDLLTLRAHLEQIGAMEEIGGLSYLVTLDLDLPDRASRVHWQGAGEVLDRLLATIEEGRPVTAVPSAPRSSDCGKLPLFPRTPISPAGGLTGYGRLPPPPSHPAPSHTPWKTLRVSHSPPATTASGGESRRTP